MDGLLFRILRPMAVGIVMFGAVFALTDDPYVAVACTLIPLLLGWLGILDSLAYGLTAVALLLAVFTAVLPEWIKEDAREIYDKVVVRMKDSPERRELKEETGQSEIERAGSEANEHVIR